MLVDEGSWNSAIAEINCSSGRLSWDTETTGTDWKTDKVVSVQIQLESGRAFYFPFRHGEGPNLEESKLRQLLTEVIRPDRLQLGFNLAYDLKIAAKDGLKLPEKIQDAMLTAHLMNENEPSTKMEALAVKYLGEQYATAEDELIEKIMNRFGCPRKGAKGHLWKLPASEVITYGLQDVATNFALMDFYQPHIDHWGLREVQEGVADFQLALVDIEKRGMLVDRNVLERLESESTPKAEALEAQIQETARTDLRDPLFPANPRSHVQMKMWLNRVLGVPNTSAGVLKLQDDPRAQLLLDYRIWHKLGSAFAKPYQKLVTPEGKIHASLWITSSGLREKGEVRGTVSGRLSCSDPNLQQQPKPMKEAFYAPEGFTFVEFDYSQAELVTAAYYYAVDYNDPTLARILLDGRDYHQETAMANNLPRKKAKGCNFAITYGAGAFKLAQTMNMKVQQAARYLATYNRMFPGSQRMARKMQSLAERKGYIRLYTGRTRRYNCIQAETRKAKNNKIQGTVGEMVRIAVSRIHREIPEFQMVMSVHDSIVGYLANDRLFQTIDEVKEIMQHQPWCSLPYPVDVTIGRNWKDGVDLPRIGRGLTRDQLELTRVPELRRMYVDYRGFLRDELRGDPSKRALLPDDLCRRLEL